MKRKFWLLAVLAAAIAMALVASPAMAETLSWNAVTTYTDGSPISSPVTYTAVWSMSSTLSTPTTLASAISTTSSTFSVSTAGMPRGSTIYFGVRATVGGVNSAWSAPISWLVPALAPDAPTNLRIQ